MRVPSQSPPVWLLAATVVAGLCGLDGIWSGGGAHAVAAGAGLGAALGGLVGLGWGGLEALSRRLPAAGALAGWLGLGLGLGHWLAGALEAWSRLQGPHQTLALVALGLAYGGGAALGGAAFGLAPRAGGAPLARRGLLRGVLSVGLAAAAVVMLRVDRVELVGVYPEAHLALQAASLWALVQALRLGLGPSAGEVLGRRARLAGAVAVLGASLAAFIGLHGEAPRTLAALTQRPLTALALDTLRAWTDVDGDGLSSLLGGGDRAPFDPEIGAFSGILEADPTQGEAAGQAAGPAPLSVVLITVDTLRPDRMSLYGHARPTTPRIDGWAQGALRFDRAYTNGSWTSLAISSLMRGVYPRRLRWTRLAETSHFRLLRVGELGRLEEGEELKLMFGLPLDDPRPTLAERLAERGMYTVGVVDDGYSNFLSPKLGAAKGFARYFSVDDLPKAQRHDGGTTDLALEALRGRPEGQPFFLWVHYFGPHSPSRRLGPAWAFGPGVANEYDHEVQYNDAQVGRLLSALDALAEDEPLAVILTSDHGELFFERRRLHGIGLQEHLVRVPLVVKAPGFAAGASALLVSLVDLMPTILGLTQTPSAGALDGADLRGLLADPPARRIIFSETWRFGRDKKPVRDLLGAFDGAHMWVHDRVRNVNLLFSQQDFAETQKDLAGRVKAPHLEEALQRYLGQTRGGRVDLND